jgi:hypothetical protein
VQLFINARLDCDYIASRVGIYMTLVRPALQREQSSNKKRTNPGLRNSPVCEGLLVKLLVAPQL